MNVNSSQDAESVNVNSSQDAESVNVNSSQDAESVNVNSSQDAESVNVTSSQDAEFVNVNSSQDAESVNVNSSQDAESVNVNSSQDAESVNVNSSQDAESVNVTSSQDAESVKVTSSQAAATITLCLDTEFAIPSPRESSSQVTARSAVPNPLKSSSLLTARSAVPNPRESSSLITDRSAIPSSRESSSPLNPGRTPDPHSNPPSSSQVSASSAPPERPQAPASPERPQAPASHEWHLVPKIGPGRVSDAKISAPEPVPVLEFVPMLVAILKAKEAIQEPLECPAMTREVVCGPAAYPVTLGIGICPMVQSPSGGLPFPLLYPGGLQFCPGGVQRRLLCPGGLQLCLFRPVGHQLHLLHPGWIPALFFFMDLHSMDLALHPSRLLHLYCWNVWKPFLWGGTVTVTRRTNTAFPSIPPATHLHSILITHS